MKNIKCALIFMLFIPSLQAQQANTMIDLDVKIGQMILVGFPKAEVDAAVLQEVQSGKVGSIILFEKNVPLKKNSSYSALKKITWTYAKAAPLFPLLISIDQEGGKVNRLKDKYGFTRSITEQEMGRSRNLDSVKFYAEATAATLAGLGINVNFAPVVDLAVNKDNTVIYKAGRSFSADPDSVTMLAEEYMRPNRKYGVINVLKHFPGHGSSTTDSHFGVADVTNSWTDKELIPYQRLIAAGKVDAVMSAHIVNKKLDPRGLPGTLSTRMVDSLLRKQMFYDGVVFSDDMHMQAISKQYGLEESIKLAILAGVDILCFSNNVPAAEQVSGTRVHAIIRSLVDRGIITPERIDQSFNRVIKLKFKDRQTSEELLKNQIDGMQKELNELKKASEPVKKNEVKEEPKSEIQQPAEEETGKKKKKEKVIMI